ncbi:MAG: DUF3306 domain-containing protein [Flavobacteriales bacterium TMED235]|nr:MAG: DUF3306 domain-containing protein [Flavobacteriales bacterium TMED235]
MFFSKYAKIKKGSLGSVTQEKKNGFLSRWSRRKILDQEKESRIAGASGKVASIVEHRGVIENDPNDRLEHIVKDNSGTPENAFEGLSDTEILEKLKLPDPEKMKAGDDFKVFLTKTVPEHIKKRALRKLWVSNPVLANLDGMNEYDDDFTLATSALEEFATNYVVGKGFRGQFKPEETEDEGDLIAGDMKSSSVRLPEKGDVDSSNESLEEAWKEDQVAENKVDKSKDEKVYGVKEQREGFDDKDLVKADAASENKNSDEEEVSQTSRIKPKKMVFKS